MKYSEVCPLNGQTPINGFNPNADIVLITKRGYLLLVKSFSDDLAWQVQGELVDTYFEVKQQLSPCAASIEKDKINKWKRAVSNPIVERLYCMNGKVSLQQIYGLIYKDMNRNFAFDMNKEKSEFCNKYNAPFNEVAIIDVVADNKKLRVQFLMSAQNCIENVAKMRIQDARDACEMKISEIKAKEILANRLWKEASEFNESFETEIENNKLIGVDGACGMALTTM